MLTLSFGVSPKTGSVKLERFVVGLEGRLITGMRTAGAILERDMKRKLSGPGRYEGATAGPITRLNNYPGVRTGTLRRSVHAKIVRSGGIPTLIVGPNVAYAEPLELGTKNMPGGYPFVRPTWESKGERAIEAIRKAVVKPLKG